MTEIPRELIDKLLQSKLTLAVTGSGISADSGIPTFRDAQTGIWSKFRPEELATREAFAKNPGQVWDWYAWRRELVAQAQPNTGHIALAQLEQDLSRLELVTQNVDSLHQRAGSEAVIEFHGNITRNKCFDRDTPIAKVDSDTSPPVCPCCGGWVRPDVVWFGEAIDDFNLYQAFSLVESCDVFLSVGTSSQVFPAAGLLEIALQSSALTVEVNAGRTPFSTSVDYYFEGSAADILPWISAGVDTAKNE